MLIGPTKTSILGTVLGVWLKEQQLELYSSKFCVTKFPIFIKYFLFDFEYLDLYLRIKMSFYRFPRSLRKWNKFLDISVEFNDHSPSRYWLGSNWYIYMHRKHIRRTAPPFSNWDLWDTLLICDLSLFETVKAFII